MIGLLALLEGCASFVTHKIEHPDRAGTKVVAAFRENLREQGFREASMLTSDGVRIVYWLGEPRRYSFEETLQPAADGKRLRWRLRLPDQAPAAPLPARGSVVLLHPWGGEGAVLAHWAYRFASEGYVTVMPDLRGQGQSDAAPVGYGPREGEDVAELVEQLRTMHRLPSPLFLVGLSYGGTVALFGASAMPDVGGVIALEPYDNAADVIRRAPSTGLFGPRWLGAALGSSTMDKAIARASGELGVDLAHVDVRSALHDAPCTLLVRGAKDDLISAAGLQDAAHRAPRVRYVEIPGENHFSLPLRTDRLMRPMLEWMAAAGAPSNGCPAFVPLSPGDAVRASRGVGTSTSAPAPTTGQAPAAHAPPAG